MSDTNRKRVIQRYYSARAKDYDRQKSRTWRSEQGFGTEVFDELLSALRGFENKLLLEVGIGSGRNARPLLEKVKPRLVGLDLTKEMLSVTRDKMSAHKHYFDLILGDAEHLPFVTGAFDAILCMSTMHYFADQKEVLERLIQLLKKGGKFVCGDLSPHDSDSQGFFEALERTVSKAHSKYHKASEMRQLLENHGFHVSRMKTISYRKDYRSLIEDKGSYFGIKPQKLHRYIHRANREAREQYGLTETDLAQFYTVIVATRKTESG